MAAVLDLVDLVGRSIVAVLVLYAAIAVLNRVRGKGRLPPEGRTVVITGCDSGFGFHLSRLLVQRGYSVVAGCFTDDAIAKANAVNPAKLLAAKLDVTSDESVEAFAQVVAKRTGGRVWALVNNAGINTGVTADLTDIGTYKAVMEVNCFGGIRMCKALRTMLARGGVGGASGDGGKGGRIINVTSIAGRISPPMLAAYGTSKFAFEAYSDALRADMWAWGISVHLMEPAFHRTPIVTDALHLLRRFWERLPKETKADYGEAYGEALLAQAAKSTSTVINTSDDPMNVVHAMEHAVGSTHPRLRYYVGAATFLFVPLALLPTGLYDACIAMFKRLIDAGAGRLPTPVALQAVLDERAASKSE